VKLEAKRTKAITNVSPIVEISETDNEDNDILLVYRTRYKLQNKIRLSMDYSVKY
jgi:hypothetical protein